MTKKRKGSLRSSLTVPVGVQNDRYEYQDDSDNDRSEGRVRIKDDESIDDDGSEVGWNEEDEAIFGASLMKNKRRGAEEEEEEEDEDDMSDQEEAEEGEILLSDLISGKGSTTVEAEDMDKEEEEEEEDEFVEEEDKEEEEDEDGEGEEKHAALLHAMEKFSKTESAKSKSLKRKSSKAFEQSFDDSPFSSLVGHGSTVSMDTLLGALEDTKGVKAVTRSLLDMNKTMRAPKQTDRVVSARMERTIVYEESKKDMDKWKERVQLNRHVKTLDLTDDRYLKPSYKSLVEKYEPSNDLEREIQMVLVKSGAATEQQVLDREEEALASRELDEEEIRMRQAELGKVRALMFYEQMKRARINKIKSKAYHKIRKKQRLRKEGGGMGASEAEEDDEGNDEEDVDFKRVKERMDLKHKNTGRWAKMALTFGKGDKTLRYEFLKDYIKLNVNELLLGKPITSRFNWVRIYRRSSRRRTARDLVVAKVVKKSLRSSSCSG